MTYQLSSVLRSDEGFSVMNSVNYHVSDLGKVPAWKRGFGLSRVADS